jgi:hypothetical protein
MKDDLVAASVAEDVVALIEGGGGASPIKLVELMEKWREEGVKPQACKVAHLLTSCCATLLATQSARCEVLERALQLAQRTFPPPAIQTGTGPLVQIGGVQQMVDQYSAGQAGAMGPQSVAHHNTFQQIWVQSAGSIDLSKLAGELAQLRREMRARADEADHDEAVGAVASAEKGYGPLSLDKLRSAGKWALEVATDISTTIAAEAIKKSMGL